MAPNFMAARARAIKLKTKRSQTTGDLPVRKSCQAAH
jgi:hypothetical protein